MPVTIHIPSAKPEPEPECDLSSAKQMLATYQKSLRERWKMPESARAGIYHFAASVISNDNMPTRAKLNAAKILISLDTLESTERRAVTELTLRHELAGMMAGGSEALSSLVPPIEGESMIDDTPVSSPTQGGQHDA